MVKFLQRFDEEIIKWKPDRATPVRVAAEQAGSRFTGVVIYDLLFAAYVQNVRMIFVKFADRSDTVGAQKLFRIKHAAQQTLHAMAASEGDETARTRAGLLPARTQARKIRPVLQVPFESLFETGDGVEQFGINRFDGQQRHQAN